MVKKSFGLDMILGINERVYSGAEPCPLTGLAYTYDRGNTGSEVCPSESVIINGSTPVRPLNGSSDEIWDRATTLSAKDL